MPQTDKDGAKTVAEKKKAMIQKITDTAKMKKEKGVTASFGVAEYKGGETLEQLIGRADKALYQAKEEGRNLVKAAD